MSDPKLSQEDLQKYLSELAKVSTDNLQKVFPTCPEDKDWDEIEERISNGEKLKDIYAIPDDYMEQVYQFGKKKLETQDFQSAKGIFSALCLYDQVNPKYWICLANCLEHLDLYKEAADCYRLLCLVTKGVDPMPYLCLGYCCLQINDKANAQEALELGRELCESAQNEDRQLVEQFDKLLNLC